MADTCAACGTPAASTARWCGHCGARLGGRERGGRTRAGESHRPRPADPALVGARTSVLLLDDVDEAEEVAPAGRTWSPRARLAAAAGVVLVLVGALVARPEPEVTYEPRGFTARGDAARSGVVSLAPLAAPTAVAWSADVGAGRSAHTVRSAGDLVIERTGGGILAVRDTTTGELRWVRRDVAPGGDAVRVGDAIVATDAAGLRGFALADGTERWSVPGNATDCVASCAGGSSTQLWPLGDDVIALEQPDGRLSAVLARTGLVRWSLHPRQLDASIQRVVVGGAGIGLWLTRPPGLPVDSPRVEHLAALVDPADGELRFVSPLPAGGPASGPGPPIAVGDRAVATVGQVPTTPVDVGGDAEGTELPVSWDVVVRGTDGAVVRRLGLGHPEAMAATGGFLAVLHHDALRGFDLRTGVERWVRPDLAGRATALVAADDVVVAVGDGAVIDAATGRTLRTLQRLDPRSIEGETDVGVLPTVAGWQVELVPADGGELSRHPLLTDEAAAPAVGAGRAFVPTRDGLRALHVADGGLDWSYGQLETGLDRLGSTPTAHTPAVATTTVALTPGSRPRAGGVVALELTGGVRTWDRDDDVPLVRGPLTLAGDVAFVPVGAEVHGYDVVTGRRAFAAVARATLGPLVVSPNRVIGGPVRPDALTSPGVVAGEEAVAILRRDRSQNWRTPLKVCSGPALAGDRVVWGTAAGISALEERTGARSWDVALPRPVCLDPVAARGRVVVVEDPGTLRAVDAADGTVVWSTPLPATAVAAPVLAGDHLLVPLIDGTLRAYAFADGAEAWTFDLAGIADAAATVLDDRVLVHLRDGRLLALRP